MRQLQNNIMCKIESKSNASFEIPISLCPSCTLCLRTTSGDLDLLRLVTIAYAGQLHYIYNAENKVLPGKKLFMAINIQFLCNS